MKEEILEVIKTFQTSTNKLEKEKAFETIYKEFSKAAYFLALKIMKDPQIAEDITQDVFVKVFQKIDDLKEPQAFPAWFKRITVNQCTYILKKNNKLPIADDEENSQLEFVEETDDRLLPEKSLDNSETARLITEIVDKLPTPQRVCVYYYYYEQLSVADIAETLTVSENTIKTRLSLAREKIRKGLKKLEEKDGIKLYSIAPIIIPALLKTMSETQVPAHLFGKISSELGLALVTSTGTATAVAATALKTKILIATVGVVAVGGIITGIILNDDDDPKEVFNAYDVYNTGESVSENTANAITSETQPFAESTGESAVTQSPESTLSETIETITITEETAQSPTFPEENPNPNPPNDRPNPNPNPSPNPNPNPNPNPSPNPNPNPDPQPNNPYANLKVGDSVQVGSYDWRVYDVQNGRALIISNQVLALRQYHSDRRVDVTWEISDVRGWLNGGFYNDTFSAEEKKYIMLTTIENANNQWHGTFGGNSTSDRVFLPSLEEVVRYFGDSGQLNTRSSSPINDSFNSARTALFDGSKRW